MTDKDAAQLSARQQARLDLTLTYISSAHGQLDSAVVSTSVNEHMKNLFSMDPTLLGIAKLWDEIRKETGPIPKLSIEMINILDSLLKNKRVESEVVYGKL